MVVVAGGDVVVVAGVVVVVVERGGAAADSEPSDRFAGVELKLKTPTSPIRVPVMTRGARFMLSFPGRCSCAFLP